MGLFDRFGSGGGKVSFELTSTTMRCGGTLVGTLVFTGGKREQVIEGMQIWFVKVEDGKDEMLYAPTKIAVRDVVQPGEVKRFVFEVVVPKVLELRINGEIARQIFGLRGSLEIPKEIDPQGKLDGLDILGGVEATMTVGAG